MSLSTSHRTKRTQGFSLMEIVVYAALIALAASLVVMGLLNLGKAYKKIQSERQVNEAGTIALDRVTREFRRALDPQYNPVNTGNLDSVTIEQYGTFAEQVRRDGAVSHWDFEETRGRLIDRIGTAHGNLIDLPDSQRGVLSVVGRAYNFIYTGSENNYINLPTNLFNAHTRGTIEVITNHIGATGSWGFLFSSGSRFASGGATCSAGMTLLDPIANPGAQACKVMHVSIDFDGKFTLGKKALPESQTGGANMTYKRTRALAPGEYHLVAQSDGVVNDLYVNGEKELAPEIVGSFSSANWFDDFNAGLQSTYYWIGRSGSYSTRLAHDPSEIVIYPPSSASGIMSLSDAKLKAHYEAAFSIKPTVPDDHKVTKKIAVESGRLVLKMFKADGIEANAYVQYLTPSGVTVTEFNLYPVWGYNQRGIRIVMTLTAGSGATQSSTTYITAASVRQ